MMHRAIILRDRVPISRIVTDARRKGIEKKRLSMKMEVTPNKKCLISSASGEDSDGAMKVRVIISCSSCSYRRSFNKTFPKNELELLVVSMKIFDWMTCGCGNLLDVNVDIAT